MVICPDGNLNGSDLETMNRELHQALLDLDRAIEALGRLYPHPRDYQDGLRAHWMQAEEARRRLSALRGIRDQYAADHDALFDLLLARQCE